MVARLAERDSTLVAPRPVVRNLISRALWTLSYPHLVNSFPSMGPRNIPQGAPHIPDHRIYHAFIYCWMHAMLPILSIWIIFFFGLFLWVSLIVSVVNSPS